MDKPSSENAEGCKYKDGNEASRLQRSGDSCRGGVVLNPSGGIKLVCNNIMRYFILHQIKALALTILGMPFFLVKFKNKL